MRGTINLGLSFNHQNDGGCDLDLYIGPYAHGRSFWETLNAHPRTKRGGATLSRYHPVDSILQAIYLHGDTGILWFGKPGVGVYDEINIETVFPLLPLPWTDTWIAPRVIPRMRLVSNFDIRKT